MKDKKSTITIPPILKGYTTGMTTSKGGVHRTRKDRERKRSDKFARRQKSQQIADGDHESNA